MKGTHIPLERMTSEHLERFWSKVDKVEGECWEWTAFRSPDGYGRVTTCGVALSAHRVSWALANGPIPDGRVIDHVCRNRACVNPDHLRCVSVRANTLENSLATSAINARKTHCKRGHPLSGDNLYVIPSSGSRACRACSAARLSTPEARERSNAHHRKWKERDPEGYRAYFREAYAKRQARKRVEAQR